MRIGVVSDTHDNLRNVRRIVELLREARVARVVHTGDITRPDTLEALAGVGVPIHGVFGNNDLDREGLGRAAALYSIELAEPPLRLVWAERRITVVHDPEVHAQLAPGPGELLLHGHHHRRVLERERGALVFNPGECAGWLDGHNSVGVVDLERLDAELLRF